MDENRTTNLPAAQLERFLRIDEVLHLTGLGKSYIYEAVRSNAFPPSVPLPGGRVAWLQSEILAWQQSRIALRDTTRHERTTRSAKP